MNRTDELKPCPFCGDLDDFNPSISKSYQHAEPGNPAAGLLETGAYGECDKCTGCGPNKPTTAEAIAAWNTRATQPDTALREEIADLKMSVIAFGAPWAVSHAKNIGLADGELHPAHYDILARAGAQMDSFTRAALGWSAPHSRSEIAVQRAELREALEPTEAMIDAAAKHLRETTQSAKGALVSLKKWDQLPKAAKRKWIDLATSTLRAALDIGGGRQ